MDKREMDVTSRHVQLATGLPVVQWATYDKLLFSKLYDYGAV